MDNETLGGKIISLITDDRCRKILNATHRRPQTPHEIRDKTGLPIATVYRLLGKIQDTGIIIVIGSKLVGMKRARVYFSIIQQIDIQFKFGSWKTTVTRREKPKYFENVYIHSEKYAHKKGRPMNGRD